MNGVSKSIGSEWDWKLSPSSRQMVASWSSASSRSFMIPCCPPDSPVSESSSSAPETPCANRFSCAICSQSDSAPAPALRAADSHRPSAARTAAPLMPESASVAAPPRRTFTYCRQRAERSRPDPEAAWQPASSIPTQSSRPGASPPAAASMTSRLRCASCATSAPEGALPRAATARSASVRLRRAAWPSGPPARRGPAAAQAARHASFATKGLSASFIAAARAETKTFAPRGPPGSAPPSFSARASACTASRRSPAPSAPCSAPIGPSGGPGAGPHFCTWGRGIIQR